MGGGGGGFMTDSPSDSSQNKKVKIFDHFFIYTHAIYFTKGESCPSSQVLVLRGPPTENKRANYKNYQSKNC